jgi:MFS family permease
METMSSSTRTKFYYGWAIVGLSMISMSFWFGLRTTFSVFFVVLIDHFQWSRAEAATAQSITMFVYMITAPVVGSLVDRLGPQKVLLPGTLLMGLGLILCTQIQTLLQFYLFFGVIVGIGATCLSIAPFTVILTHWFERKRGTANGLAGIGIGFGTLLFVPLSQYLITIRGWQFAYLIFGILVLTIPLPLNALFLRHRPEEMGLLPNGDLHKNIPDTDDPRMKANEVLHPSLTQKELMLRNVMNTGRFRLLILFPSLTVFGVYIVIVHHVKYLVDLGVDKMWAASLFAGMGALSAGFRFFWGWFSDRMGREITFTLGGVCFSSGILFLLMFQSTPSYLFLYLFAILFGAGWGVTAPMFMSISGDLYRGKDFGLIYGMVEGVIGLGGASGAWLAGYIYDQTRNYFWAFVLAILFNLISIILVWFVAPRKFRQIKSSKK